MVGNPYRWKAVIPQLENRNSTAGCLLALLFFVPILAKTFHISVGVIALFVAIYVSIIVPIGTGIISKKYIIGRIRKLSCLVFDDEQWNCYLIHLSYLSSWANYIYFQVDGVQTFTLQVMFNAASEKLFCPGQRFSHLYALLFYSFLAYIQRSLQERPWTQLFSENSTTEFVKLTAAFVIAKLGKCVTVSFVLLTFNHQFNIAEPTSGFLTTTFFYFCLTQYHSSGFVKNTLVDWLTRLELQVLDGLEEHWIPVFIHTVTIGMSVTVFMGLLIYTNNYIIMFFFGLISIFIPFKYALQPAWEKLCEQKAIISRFSMASWKNPQIRGGYPCPVCLDKMRLLSARVTPCGHVFHGSCLRKCLHHSKQCPLCKSSLS